MIEKSVLEKLYLDKHLSMVEVAHQLKVSNHKVVWWMSQYNIPRRSRSEATYVKHNPNGDPFKIKDKLTLDEEVLLGLGIGLFMGEGNKANQNVVRLGNSDPRLIRLFLRFLREICQVEERKIRFWLQIFADIDEFVALNYWIEELQVSRSQFTPNVIVSPPQGKGTYRNKCKYGVVTVFVSNSKLRQWIGEQIEKLSRHSSEAEHLHGKQRVSGSIPDVGSIYSEERKTQREEKK